MICALPIEFVCPDFGLGIDVWIGKRLPATRPSVADPVFTVNFSEGNVNSFELDFNVNSGRIPKLQDPGPEGLLEKQRAKM